MPTITIPTKTLPANFGPLHDADGTAKIKGPCGDTMEFWIAVKDSHISYATYTTDGCYHSIMCGSAAALLAVGKELSFVREFKPEYVLAIDENIPEDHRHCALLAVNTLKAAIDGYLAKQYSKERSNCDTGDCRERSEQPTHPSGKQRTPENNPLANIKHKITVLSGKGGVGKSTIAANLAFSFASAGRKVGLLDVDLHGPSIPKMLGIQHEKITAYNGRMLPAETGGVKVISIGLLTQAQGDPLIWRGPMKATVIRQFIEDVEWGDLDFLIVDCPPGTGDEPLSVLQTLGEVDGAVIVTTPQDVSVIDVRKSIRFCQELNTPVIGVIENMSGFVCPGCGESIDIFKANGGRKLAEEMGVPFLGRIPVDPKTVEAGDEGKPFIKSFPDSASSKAVMDAFSKICSNILDKETEKSKNRAFLSEA